MRIRSHKRLGTRSTSLTVLSARRGSWSRSFFATLGAMSRGRALARAGATD